MVIHHLENAEMARMFDIEISHLDGLDFPAGWGKVAPGERSASHQHDETEMFVIVSGEGTLLVDGHSHAVKAGSVAQFAPFESHVLENTGNADLIFFLQYRRDAASAARSAASQARQDPARPQFVFSTPPTPNGDLHLGHLSGPYLGADAFVRYQRLLGNQAWHMTGSDDFQSYVVALAHREGSTPAEVARYYSQEIRQTLSMMDIELDHYTVTNDAEGYADGAQRFFSRLVQSGEVQMREAPALCDRDSGHYLYEVDVAGACPGCGNATNGNICEECGEPNVVTDLGAPITKASQLAPHNTPVKRYMLPLHQFASAVEEHHKTGRVPARMRELAQRVFSRGSLDVPMSHPSGWGIAPAEAEGEGQVIWVWPEMSYGFLWDIEQLGKKVNQPWKADQPDASWKIVHFFGYDNSFYHSILYPVLYRLAYPDWQPDIDYHHNEFYLLDGKKFSTSRRHAVWGKEILTPESVDAVRFYLSLTRPEQTRTNFQLAAYQTELRQTLLGEWQGWLHDLGQRTERLFAGQAPDAGIWTKEQVAFWAQLNGHLQRITDALNRDGFSLRRAAQQLKMLVQDTLVFSQSQQRLAAIPAWKDEYRTSLALELAAAQLLSRIAQPLMPRFADRLAAALGNTGGSAWPQQAEIVTPGNAITLHQVRFFSDPDAQQDTPHWAWLHEKLATLLPNVDAQPAQRLAELGATSLMAVTLQYYLLNEMQADIPLEFLLNQPLDKVAGEVVRQQSSAAKGVTA
ncbi:class I tRNA ligase family protein [Erwinia psidii]|uniref:Methionyl-tRNA synthetase n=1 Tax=Erwinia psidii TaxID=69224 RepID=A0A3N6TW92_9GAMM|nr:class I tRNA ligase family protein [Erwinia psidii]MCX8957642.1 cupin domain-containing protein [Erwinia psidii]MCX8964059.1 cupin domain-containing protein [Erwinia psidii]RQM39542.1 cupin domain-containing protein [Erwinia psidii]